MYQLFSGKFQKAKTLADRVLATVPNNPQALFTSGASAFYLQQFKRARARLSAYLSQQPQDTTARALLGTVMLKLGLPDDAYDTVRGVEQIPSDNFAYLGVLTAAAFQTGDTAAGLNYLEQLAAKRPDNAAVQESLGAARIAMGDLPGGIAALQQAVTIAPSRLSAHKRLFAAQLRTDNFEEALAVAEAVERHFPKQASGPTLQAIVALRKGDRSAAKAAFEKAVRLEPDDVEAGSNLATILWRAKPTISRTVRFFVWFARSGRTMSNALVALPA